MWGDVAVVLEKLSLSVCGFLKHGLIPSYVFVAGAKSWNLLDRDRRAHDERVICGNRRLGIEKQDEK
jgi:hypothetical protein